MLRFGTKSAAARARRAAGPARGRVWMLLAMLGAVTLLMRQLERRDAGEQLGRALAMPAPGETTASGEAPPQKALPLPGDPAAWAAVKDNAPFLPAEQEAWFSLLEQAREASAAADAAPAGTDVAYAQLVSQPETYRGQPVRVRGAVLRESLKRAPENDRGIAEYHQLTLAPSGGGDLPFVVYTLDLPSKFPRGDDLRESVVVDGYFFKTWSFSDGEQMGLAPVIVVRSIHWQAPKAAARQPAAVGSDRLWFGVVGAAAAAACLAAWVAWQTRRPRVSTAVETGEATRASLARLAEAEAEP